MIDLAEMKAIAIDPNEATATAEGGVIWGELNDAAAEQGSPLMVDVGPMPYPVMNTLLDAGFPAGSLNYWLSSLHARPPRHRAVARRDDGALCLP
jgi:hypothetical protein